MAVEPSPWIPTTTTSPARVPNGLLTETELEPEPVFAEA
jgi:hypothetical protein